MRKNTTTAALFLAGACLSLPVAAEQTYHGSICEPYVTNSMEYSHDLDGFRHTDTAVINQAIVCRTQTEQAIGNARWRFRIQDLSTAQGFACQGVILDANGAFVLFTPNANTSAAFTGVSTLTAEATSGGYSSTFSHVLYCGIPNNGSLVSRITLD